MKGTGILFLIGILLIIAKYTKFMIINNLWIIGCFLLWFILMYVSIHSKNKYRNIPRPVYLSK